ncbi:adenylate kinase 8 isoform X2 [Engystomops pustulosus]|uniref:adenylate kinase 8 isoform X2 n=1 Tax=Engystomops pustulosus TaxID=76066 RepID=UPI003AFB0C23
MDGTARARSIPPHMAVYAEQHQVFHILQKMVENLLIDRPEDPIQYLIDHLKKDNDDVPRIVVLGPPASGKHTMEIPDALWARIIQERLSQVDCTKRGWVLEGFPRTREQALLLQIQGISPDHVVVLDAPDIVLIERNIGKRIDPTTGEVYHVTFDWPEDPELQRKLVEPAGITEDETGKRLLEYHRNIPGILRAFPKKYKKINADQPCMDVFSQVLTFVLSKPRSLAPFTPRILLYGPPGSGRSLQAMLLAQKYDIVNVSCGQVLKEAVADQTKRGLLIEPYIEKQQQVPDNLVLRLLGERLSRLDCATQGWVLHGFPRDVEQAALLQDAGHIPNRVFFLDIPDDVAIERLSLRMTDPVSGERYHSLYRPAPRVEVHERLQQNPADAEQKVQARLDMYHAGAEELEEFYQDVVHVNADQDPYTVHEFIESCVIRPLPKRDPRGPPST